MFKTFRRVSLVIAGCWLLASCSDGSSPSTNRAATIDGTEGTGDVVVTGQLMVSDLPESVVGDGVVKAALQEIQVTDASGNVVAKTYSASDGTYAAVIPGSLVIDTSVGSGDAVAVPKPDQGRSDGIAVPTGRPRGGRAGLLAETSSLSIGATILKTADESVIGFKESLNISSSQRVIKLGETPLKKITAIRGVAQLDGARDHSGILVYVPGTSFAARSDAAGLFVMTGIEPGSYSLQFEKDGFLSSKVSEVVVQKDETAKVPTQVLRLSGGASNFVVKQIGTEGYSRSRTVEFLITAGTADRFKAGLVSDLPNLSYGSVPNSWSYTFPSDGTFDLVMIFANADGFETTVERSIVVDTVAPTTSGLFLADRSDLGTSLTNERYVLAYHASCQDIAKVAVLPSSVVEPRDSDFVYDCYASSSTDISYTLPSGTSSFAYRLWVRDAAGNQSAEPATGSITLDTTAPGAPDITLTDQTSGSSLGTDITTVNVTVNSCTDIKAILISESQLLPPSASQFSLQCTTTANAFNYTFANNIAGTKTLLAWSLDHAGNVGQVSSTHTIVLDSTPPTAASFTLSDPTPTGLGISNSLSLVATPANCTDTTHVLVSETQSTRPSESDAGWQACSVSGVSATAAGDGTRTFYLWARDIGGNVSLTSTTASIQVDATPPTAPSLTLADLTNPTANASSYTNAQTISATVGSCADASFILLTQSSATPDVASLTTPCTTSAQNFVLDNSSNELKTVYLWVLDSAGNLSTTAASAQITVDTQNPSLPGSFAITDVDSDSAAYTNSTSLDYAVDTCPAGEYILLKQDQNTAPAESSADWAACATSGTWASLVSSTAGAKTVYLWRKDRAGNIDGPLSDSITWDGTAPDDVIVSSPVATYNTYYTQNSSIAVAGTAEAGTTIQITGGATTAAGTVDGGGNFSINVSLNNNTTHTLTLTATDEPGNVSDPVTITLVRDTIAPTIASVAVSLTDSTATVSWSTNESANRTFDYGSTAAYGSSDHSSSYTTSHSVSLSGLSSGTTYYYRIRATDQAGNTDNANEYTGSFKTYIPKTGNISSNETWSDTSTSYYIGSSNLTVDSGITLTINPGVTVQFGSGRRMNVSGTLVARGTSNSRIRFISNQLSPTANYWDGLNFASTSTAPSFDGNGDYLSGNIIEYADIAYGGSSGAMIKLTGATGLALFNSVLSYGGSRIGSGSLPLLQMESDSSVHVRNSSFLDIPSYAIYVNYQSTGGGGTLEVKNSTFTSSSSATGGNRNYMIYNDEGDFQLTDLTITGNTFSDIQGYDSSNNGHAIGGYYWSTNDALIASNFFKTSDIYAEAIAFSGHGTIEKNIILFNSSSYGIRAATGASSKSLNIQKNVIKSSKALYVGSSGASSATYSVTGNILMPLSASFYAGGISALSSNSATYTISNNTIQHSSISGSGAAGALIHINPGTTSTVTGAANNIINSTANYVLYNQRSSATATMNFQGNWWGTSSNIDDLIFDNSDNSNYSIVDSSNALAAPSTTAPISSPGSLSLSNNGSGNVTISWNHVAESDKAGYRVYYKWGTSGYPYDGTGATQGASGFDVGDVNSTSLDLPTGQGRTYYITVTAYDDDADGSEDLFDGHESWYATEVSVYVP